MLGATTASRPTNHFGEGQSQDIWELVKVNNRVCSGGLEAWVKHVFSCGPRQVRIMCAPLANAQPGGSRHTWYRQPFILEETCWVDRSEADEGQASQVATRELALPTSDRKLHAVVGCSMPAARAFVGGDDAYPREIYVLGVDLVVAVVFLAERM
mmetsp:Transcript_9705/g.17088  ORF Transcript_9705/g.17088 Transcript_9705/m.17088 type:complete len:155 (-) Transcript_9705:1357-1821(-)